MSRTAGYVEWWSDSRMANKLARSSTRTDALQADRNSVQTAGAMHIWLTLSRSITLPPLRPHSYDSHSCKAVVGQPGSQQVSPGWWAGLGWWADLSSVTSPQPHHYRYLYHYCVLLKWAVTWGWSARAGRLAGWG